MNNNKKPPVECEIPDFLQQEPWRIFRIMAEFVESFETMSKQGPLITVFGSARTQPEEPIYKSAVTMGRLLAENGYGALTGGGPGIMEAVNKGASEAEGKSIGLNIKLPMEQDPNPYQNTNVDFRYFFIRKVCFLKYSIGIVAYPGGFGTIDELFEVITLIQTEKINPVPTVLVDIKFWTPLIDWIKSTMINDNKICAKDVDLFKIVDTAEEAMEYIIDSHKRGITRTIKPEF